jgi:hypothetical protein
MVPSSWMLISCGQPRAKIVADVLGVTLLTPSTEGCHDLPELSHSTQNSHQH